MSRTPSSPIPPIGPILAPDLPVPAGHYSHATVANGFVFVSGQLPVTPSGERLSDAPFEAQVRQVLANVRTILQAAGTDVDHLVQVRAYIHGVENWATFNTAYAEWAGSARPARAVIPTGPLHHGVAIEMEVVALAR